jgi:hypothetical protein
MKGKRKRKICQLADFDVDFNHLGWGQWVVFPKVFNARNSLILNVSSFLFV